MAELSLAVIMACHNRREKTISCLDRLFRQVGLTGDLRPAIYLTDDASTDGTADAIRNRFPAVKILQGNGHLYWNGGMRIAWAAAIKRDYHFYIWLNDDTFLYPDAINRLLQSYYAVESQNNGRHIIAGSLQDASTKEHTYGGTVRRSLWHPFKYKMVKPAMSEMKRCDTVNGNLVLVPQAVVDLVGNLDPAFSHGMGDFDYALRAAARGCTIWVASGFFGICSRNEKPTKHHDDALGTKQQILKLNHPKGLPFSKWRVFTNRHGGPLWRIYWLLPYVRTALSVLLNIPRRPSYPCRRVVIVQQSIRHYRLRFFELLRERLDAAGIELIVIYGEPDAIEATKGDAVDLDWGIKIENLNFKMGSRNICWQPCLMQLHNADLVIVEQASKLLLNYALVFLQLVGRSRVAFWGHGKNLQSYCASKSGEGVKRILSRRVHWWFAYNDMSKKIVQDLGYPSDRITSIQNTIDVKLLSEMRQKATKEQINRARQQLGLRGNNIGIFVGAMYLEKRLTFLLEACLVIRSQIPDFEIILIGAGPEYAKVKKASLEFPWTHVVGKKFDDEKVPLFALSKVLLSPGLMGLTVLDSFAFEVPIVTTGTSFPSPEMDYLKNGYNCLIIDKNADPAGYADAVVGLFTNENARQKLVRGCRESKKLYDIEFMVERFYKGIEQALACSKK